MKKIRGFIDPYTLGFLLSLIGVTSAYFTSEKQNVEESAKNISTENQADASPHNASIRGNSN